jgi:uncharacterized RDD family membrane protein YckC
MVMRGAVMTPAGMMVPNYASWGLRLAAYLIDQVVLFLGLLAIWIPAGILIAITVSAGQGSASSGSVVAAVTLGLIAALIALVWLGGYYAFFWSRTGQTYGKRMMGIRVTREDGQLLSVGESLLRSILGMGILDSIVFGIPLGWLWPLWDEKHQAWHDKIVHSIVVRV